MNTTPRLTRWPLYFVLVMLVGTMAGAGYIFQTGRDVKAGPRDHEAAERNKQGMGVVCLGIIDLESGLIPLVPQQPGSVKEVLVYEGQKVEKGTILLKVEDEPFVRKAAEAEAGVRIAETQLAQARQAIEAHAEIVRAQEAVIRGHKEKLAADESLARKAERMHSLNIPEASAEQVELARRNVAAQKEVIAAEEAKLNQIIKSRPDAKVDEAAKNVELRKAQLEQAREALDRCILKAPQDGTVLQLQATIGSQFGATPTHPALIFAPNGNRIVRVEVDQEFAGRINLGATAQIQDEANSNGPTYAGKVTRIGDAFLPRFDVLKSTPSLSPGGDSRVLQVIVSLDDPTSMPRLGQRMRVTIGGSNR
jgi:multidrug resistance efflux pump